MGYRLSTYIEDIRRALDVIRWVNPGITVVLQPDSRETHATLFPKIEQYKKLCEDISLCGCSISQVHKITGWE